MAQDHLGGLFISHFLGGIEVITNAKRLSVDLGRNYPILVRVQGAAITADWRSLLLVTVISFRVRHLGSVGSGEANGAS